ncbi:S-layer homology domain-containing protein [uncultured Oscillibacter sp.]|uniref:S-layer homology domain-containing protein n=1 Tax=uncultured Oscillibacter sp. TaxID=876091 RepID=UPI0025FE37C4|nr:S-layer homology domain-containing protein [uncultured Oscillibacter sp.]
MRRQLQRVLGCLLALALLVPCLAPPASAAGFTDVPAGHWAAEPIRRAVELGFFQGETATRFGLGHQMTRAAFTVVLGRFFGWKAEKPERSTYTDVPAGHWAAGAVEAAYANGAVTRQSDAFRPEDPITREELAVMLVRALGYGTIAGLAQDLPNPFRDVTTNAGYITMAYDLGLVDGTSAASFSPDRTATREQAAVMLVRLYDKLHGDAPGTVGIAASVEELPELAGFDAVAAAAGQLIYQSGATQLTATASSETAAAIRDAAKAAGAKALLYVSGTENALRGDAAATAALLSAAVEAGGYDGLFLDLAQVGYAGQKALTALAAALRQALGEDLFYLAAEAPAWQGRSYDGYDYAALAAQADRLVLRVAPYTEKVGENFPTSPLEPLEEVYYALDRLRGTVAPEKLTLLLTTTAAVWTDGKRGAPVSGAAAAGLLAAGGLGSYYSSRYACAYLSGTVAEKETVVWYLDGRSAAERADLAAFFGVNQVCFTQLNGLWPDLLASLA